VLASVTLTLEFDPSHDINALEGQILEAGRAAMRDLLLTVGRELEALPVACPLCGEQRGWWDGQDARLVATTFGRVWLPRRRWRCRGCQRRSRPLDRMLAPLGEGQLTGRLREMCVAAGASWPYATAARLLERLCGAQVSAETVRQCLLTQGHARAAQQQQAAEEVVTPTAKRVRQERARQTRRTRHGSRAICAAPPPERLLVELDGGWVPSRAQSGGMEGKVGVVATGQVACGRDRQRLWPRRYVGTFASASVLGTQAYAAACQLEGDRASEQIVVGDGAEWIKTQAARHFPQATTILDWPHVARVLHRAIRAARPGRRQRALRRTLHRELPELVWHGQAQTARAVLMDLQVAAEPAAALETAISYLVTQQDWLGDYDAWQQAGYPIGSGAVEREVAILINGRMKGRGMRWTRAGADAVMAVRVDACNDAWSQRPPPPWLVSASPR
jgi:hypothetical protein